ncbi:unnamed protein product [Ixodes hexagonus]
MFSPLHSAAQAGCPDFLLRSLQTGANPNLQDTDGESPLHKAARAGNIECLQILLTAGGNPRQVLLLCNRWGQTSGQLALCLGQLSAATLLNSAELGVSPRPHHPATLTNRKRCHGGFNCAQDTKRFRIAGEEAMSEDVLQDCKPVPLLHGEETLLHRAEQGYNRVFIESWLSEVHGC